MKVFKVVDEQDGKLLSCGVLPPYELEYVPGETKQHPNMFVVDTIENAKLLGSHIWEAETSGAKPAEQVILSGDGFDFFEEYWGGKMWSIPAYYLRATPVGTLLVDDLKLIQEVQ